MKTYKMLIISMVISGLLLGGVFILTASADTLIAEQVKITPKPFDLENGDDVLVQVKLARDDSPIVDQIDPSTVLLEGYITPMSTWTTGTPPNFMAEFDGATVTACVISKIIHMGITRPRPWVPVKIDLEIRGYLYDGTPWEGTGEIKVYVPDDPPPANPPPA